MMMSKGERLIKTQSVRISFSSCKICLQFCEVGEVYANPGACDRLWVPQQGDGNALFIHRAVTSSRGFCPEPWRDAQGLERVAEGVVLTSISIHIKALGLHTETKMRALELSCT